MFDNDIGLRLHHIQSPLTKYVNIIIEIIKLGKLVGIFMGSLVMVEARSVGSAIPVVEWGILNERMLVTKHMIVKPAHLSSMWRI
jgi:hypothetical protein